eukprot:6125306-Prymnesium_polylepis.1
MQQPSAGARRSPSTHASSEGTSLLDSGSSRRQPLGTLWHEHDAERYRAHRSARGKARRAHDSEHSPSGRHRHLLGPQFSLTRDADAAGLPYARGGHRALAQCHRHCRKERPGLCHGHSPGLPVRVLDLVRHASVDDHGQRSRPPTRIVPLPRGLSGDSCDYRIGCHG